MTDEVCVFPECVMPIRSLKLCEGHYAQWNRYRSLGELRATVQTRSEDGSTRLCTRCGTWRDLPSFGLRGGNRSAQYTSDCKDCRTLRRYNITYADYVAMLHAQDGNCYLCEKNTGSTKLEVDHDHACCPRNESCGDCVRGLLCGSCNRLLGLLKDDTKLMDRMITYVDTQGGKR